MTLSVLFPSFANQELVLKQLAELKEGHLRTSERSSHPLLTHSALGVGSLMLLGALKHELGPLRSTMGSLSMIFFVIFIIISLLFVILGPLPKNSDPNPMSFQYLVGFTLGPP